MLSVISLSNMNALCDSDTNFGMIFFRQLAIVLDTILYKTFHRLIGWKSVAFSSDFVFGISAI